MYTKKGILRDLANYSRNSNLSNFSKRTAENASKESNKEQEEKEWLKATVESEIKIIEGNDIENKERTLEQALEEYGLT